MTNFWTFADAHPEAATFMVLLCAWACAEIGSALIHWANAFITNRRK